MQLAIDNEVLGMVRRLVTQIEFDDESMAWQELLTAEPGSQFLTNEHTLRHCRDGLMPVNFVRLTRDRWDANGKRDLIERATEFCKNIAKEAYPPRRPKEMLDEMDAIVARADARLS